MPENDEQRIIKSSNKQQDDGHKPNINIYIKIFTSLIKDRNCQTG